MEYQRQVGPQIAEQLKIPQVSYAAEVKADGDAYNQTSV